MSAYFDRIADGARDVIRVVDSKGNAAWVHVDDVIGWCSGFASPDLARGRQMGKVALGNGPGEWVGHPGETGEVKP